MALARAEEDRSIRERVLRKYGIREPSEEEIERLISSAFGEAREELLLEDLKSLRLRISAMLFEIKMLKLTDLSLNLNDELELEVSIVARVDIESIEGLEDYMGGIIDNADSLIEEVLIEALAESRLMNKVTLKRVDIRVER